MKNAATILVCDDDPLFHLTLKHALQSKFEIRSAYNGDEALAIIRNHSIDILLLDIQIRSGNEGLTYIPKFKDCDPDLTIIMSSGLTDFATVREAMRLGAADYVAKDAGPDEIEHAVRRTLEKRFLVQRTQQQNSETMRQQQQHLLVGSSPAILNLRKIIERVRKSPANVVITGETGTGKEVVARQLRGTLPDGSIAPFVAIDSATIQSSTAESILFGHEKGAFTGAEKMTKGVFEEANGGIVYFDEIANMPLDIQAKLLRVLQEKEVSRLGSARTMKLDFRVVCASNQDLDKMVAEGRFKHDLLQRIGVIPIALPPLRERKEDLPLLLEHFARRHLPPGGSLTFTEGAIEVLSNYSWPGNIRELSNVVAYLAAMTEGTEVDLADLPPKLRDAARPERLSAAETASDNASFYDRVAGFEKKLLTDAYAIHGNNISKMALALGMDRSHLYSKLKEYGIHTARK